MNMLIIVLCSAVFFAFGFAGGAMLVEKKIRKEVDSLKEIIEQRMYNDNLAMVIKTMMKGVEFDGCSGCHESREIFETEYKILQAIQSKNQQKTVRISECEVCHTEEEEGNRPVASKN